MFDLESIRKKYEKINKELAQSKTIIEKAKKDGNIELYIEETKNFNKLKEDFIAISLQYKLKKMEDCNHVCVITSSNNSLVKDRNNLNNHFYCVKCQLNTFLAFEKQDDNSFYKKMLQIYMKTKYKAINIYDHECHHLLAKSIYEEIIKREPNISDECLVRYFKETLNSVKYKDKKYIKFKIK